MDVEELIAGKFVWQYNNRHAIQATKLTFSPQTTHQGNDVINVTNLSANTPPIRWKLHLSNSLAWKCSMQVNFKALHQKVYSFRRKFYFNPVFTSYSPNCTQYYRTCSYDQIQTRHSLPGEAFFFFVLVSLWSATMVLSRRSKYI